MKHILATLILISLSGITFADIFNDPNAGSAGFAGSTGSSSSIVIGGTNSYGTASSSITVVNGQVTQSTATTSGYGNVHSSAISSFNGGIVSQSHFPH